MGCSNKITPQNRGVAQLVARLVRDQEVVGSNPVASTKNPKNGVSIFGFFCFYALRRRHFLFPQRKRLNFIYFNVIMNVER